VPSIDQEDHHSGLLPLIFTVSCILTSVLMMDNYRFRSATWN